jgi:phosphopantetheine--protein transferase-like protein
MPTSVRTGCDLVSIPRFRQQVGEGGSAFLERIFLPGELPGKTLERLAGMFAAKEAVCKALNRPAGAWLGICIEHAPSGAPRAVLLVPDPGAFELSISIAHDGEYALAFAVAWT